MLKLTKFKKYINKINVLNAGVPAYGIGTEKASNDGKHTSIKLLNKLKILCNENNINLFLIQLMGFKQDDSELLQYPKPNR